MPKKTFTIVNEILSCLYELGKLLPQPFETPYAHVRRIRSIQYKSYYTSVKQLQKRGAVKLTKNEGINQLQLTPKGKLEVLLIKARLKEKMKWDGKWRIIMFDIPEKSKSLRHRFRNLLKENNFHTKAFADFSKLFSNMTSTKNGYFFVIQTCRRF